VETDNSMNVRALIIASSALWAVYVAPASAAPEEPAWVASWATALQSIPDLLNPPALYRAPDVAGRTLREVVYPTVSGTEARLHISNAYGRGALVLERVGIAESGGGAALRAGTSVAVTFGGRPGLSLAPGEAIDSDPIQIQMRAGEAYAVSLLAGPRQTLTAWHRVAGQINYVSEAGDHVSDAQALSYKIRFTESAWVTGVDVRGVRAAAEPTGAVAAIGDSITDGMRSTLNKNRRWPDGLARRLAGTGQSSTAVLNLGISGNRLLSDSACYGEALAGRFERDALGHPGVRAVILLIGINDINFAAMPARAGLDCDAPHRVVTANDLIDGYRRLIDRAHRRGIRVLGGTLTPASLPAERERIRNAVNQWIRGGGAFDGVIDFDTALRDPAHPDTLQRRFDSGDHIHPSDEGYAAMADAVPGPTLAAALGTAVRGVPRGVPQ
jgi:lysophospholipase L1-like esterase